MKTPPPTVKCFYVCAACSGDKRHFVEVPERDADAMDVVTWLNDVCAPALVAHHQARAPWCKPKKFDIGIAHSGGADQPVGTKVRS